MINELTPLKNAPLKSFVLTVSRVKDLTPLAGKAINTIEIHHSPITDLKPLAGMPLMSVLLENIDVMDLSPLKGDILQTLDLRQLSAKELKPLDGCPLVFLRIRNMPKLTDGQNIPDYFPDLEELHLPESMIKPELINRLKGLKKLKKLMACSDQDYTSRAVPLDTGKKP